MDEMIGVIKLFAGTFAPRGFMLCDGTLLSIQSNTALFSILGTTYGGNGQTTFALPNLNGRTPISPGNSNTGKSYQLGEMGGTPQNTILTSNLPSFTSQLKVSTANATTSTPSMNSSIAVTGTTTGRDFTAIPSFADTAPNTIINTNSVTFIGQDQPINNMPPYLAMYYIICVEGIYPSRP
ncbi:phage tail protein [Chryseobacterium sp. RP-3-3]|uniref:Phage tail protein n=1 Tax=Chryseobacterium antibioticum TaxID=2728847 RepID=A0A7Y0FSB5_9FLAO|nr:tail fiber protein [Chryseobacterium antibioticum]NML70259.1 phage tail protein [Chryseobacterium antibioticum]